MAHGRNRTEPAPAPGAPVRKIHDNFEPGTGVQFELPPPSLNCRLRSAVRAGLRACAGAAVGAAAGAITGFAALGGVGGYVLGYNLGRGEAVLTGAFSGLFGMAGLAVAGAFQLGAGAVETPVAIAGALVGAIAGAMVGIRGVTVPGIEDSVRENLGLELENRERGYCVTRVRPDGLAAAAGLNIGDEVAAAELRFPKDAANALRALEQRLVGAHSFSYSRNLNVTRDSAPLKLTFPRTSPRQHD
ncbi:MAG: hypothetical protein U0931_13455 [Vulcanimicrobiota bacterium]